MPAIVSRTKKAPPVKVGTCHACGCTDHMPCLHGCSWVDEENTICSACIRPFLRADTEAGFRRLVNEAKSWRLLDVLEAEMCGRVLIQERLILAVSVRAIQIKQPKRLARAGLRMARGGA